MRSRRCARLSASVVLIVLSAAPFVGPSAQADHDPAPSAVLEDCLERFVIAPGHEDLVRNRVPARYELSRNAQGEPLLFVGVGECQRYKVYGSARPTTWAVFAAAIESPDGVGCFSGWPAVGDLIGGLRSCNFYLFFVVYDNPDVVSWARHGMPDAPVRHVRALDFEQAEVDLMALGAPFRFRASGSTPSHFDLELVVNERPIELPLTATFWFTGSCATARVQFAGHAVAGGQAEGNLRPKPGSDMARLFGTHTPTPAAVYPLLAANRWSEGRISKEIDRSECPRGKGNA